MSSSRPFASTTEPESVRRHGPLKPEPLTGYRQEKRDRRSTQTLLWGSGASMRNKVLNATVQTMQSASSVPKVRSIFSFQKVENKSILTPNIIFSSQGGCLSFVLDCFSQTSVRIFRVHGVCGQTGVHAPPSVVKLGFNCVPERANPALYHVLGQRSKGKNATALSAQRQVEQLLNTDIICILFSWVPIWHN